MSFCSWVADEKYRDTFKPGVYVCVQCENELFESRTKYKHFSPWPAFTDTVHEDSVVKRQEKFRPSLTYKVSCGKCGLGLGHEFNSKTAEGLQGNQEGNDAEVLKEDIKPPEDENAKSTCSIF